MLMQKIKLVYPNLASMIKTSKEVLGGRELEFKLTDDRAYIFDSHQETLRRLPVNSKRMTKDEFKIEFGYRLRKMLEVKGVSQRELSRRSGIIQSDISTYINGKKIPSFHNVDRIAKALDISVDELRYI